MRDRSYIWLRSEVIDLSIEPSSPPKERKKRAIPNISNIKRSQKQNKTKKYTSSDWGWVNGWKMENIKRCSDSITVVIGWFLLVSYYC